MVIIRAGVDSLYLAIKGTLPVDLLSTLAKAKADATAERQPTPIELADGAIKAMVPAGGQAGGYAFVFDTGPLGARFAWKETSATLEWNFFVKPHATALLALGFGPVYQKIIDTFALLRGTIIEISINRIDYAIDIRADSFILDPARFIAHPKAKVRLHWGETDSPHASAVLMGRRPQSVTVGTPPGKQVIVYDKTAEVKARQHLYWFTAWHLDPEDAAARVWRVELRLFRNELKQVRRIKGLADLKTGLRRALYSLMQHVRYIAEGETARNVSRRRADPIWQLAQQHVETADLLGGIGDLPPDRLVEITLAMKIDCHKQLISGNAAALAAVMKLDDPTVERRLPDIVRNTIRDAILTESFRRSLTRARLRRYVLFGSGSSGGKL